MLQRIPAKVEVSRALQRLATTHMAPAHKAREGAIFRSSHAKVDEAEESAAHDVVVVRSYINHLESRVRALESEVGNGELEPIPDSEVESSCGCGGAK
mgnify:CR=1 FL=1